MEPTKYVTVALVVISTTSCTSGSPVLSLRSSISG